MRTIGIVPLPPGFAGWSGLLDLIMRSFAYMDGRIDPPSSAHRLTPESLVAKAEAETVFLAMAGEMPVGCVFLAMRGDHLYLGKLAVDPAWQGKGIGRALMRAAEDFARRAGAAEIELQVRVELTANLAAFTQLGFRETARTAHEGYARPTSITMRKETGA